MGRLMRSFSRLARRVCKCLPAQTSLRNSEPHWRESPPRAAKTGRNSFQRGNLRSHAGRSPRSQNYPHPSVATEGRVRSLSCSEKIATALEWLARSALEQSYID